MTTAMTRGNPPALLYRLSLPLTPQPPLLSLPLLLQCAPPPIFVLLSALPLRLPLPRQQPPPPRAAAVGDGDAGAAEATAASAAKAKAVVAAGAVAAAAAAAARAPSVAAAIEAKACALGGSSSPGARRMSLVAWTCCRRKLASFSASVEPR